MRFPLRRCQPQSKIENKEELLKKTRAMLTRMELNLRVKGDIYRAEKVRQFKNEYFMLRE